MLTTCAIISSIYKTAFTATTLSNKVLINFSTLKSWPAIVGYSAPKIILIGFFIMFTGR
jgi:hypothetical protein